MKDLRKLKGKLKIATDNKTPSEINSIILRGITAAFASIIKKYYVSENIEALINYVNEKKILSSAEYKRLLSEAKDFYTVILCALFITPLKEATNSFKYKELDKSKKQMLFNSLESELTEFFIDWMCQLDIEPLLFYRMGISYNKEFNVNLYMKSQVSYGLTPIEEQILKEQIISIVSNYIIESVGIQLGLAGLDYIDYDRSHMNQEKHCIDTMLEKSFAKPN